MRALATCVFAAAVLAIAARASVGFGNCTSSFIGKFVPDAPTGHVKICRDGAIAIAYDPVMINPAYSAYYVTPEELKYTIPGRSDFYEDPDLRALGITQASYRSDAFNESWNRGHLCPNHIMSFSEVAKHATFTMANVAPQAAYFNQHPWNMLESDVFDWIKDNSALHMVTGVAYKDRSKARRTYDNISVPDYYFKVICDVEAGESAGFIGDNTAEEHDAMRMTTVKEVEKIYGGWLLPGDACKIDSYDPSHWWESAQGLPASVRLRRLRGNLRK